MKSKIPWIKAPGGTIGHAFRGIDGKGEWHMLQPSTAGKFFVYSKKDSGLILPKSKDWHDSWEPFPNASVPCESCGKFVNKDMNFCYGCKQVICSPCMDKYNHDGAQGHEKHGKKGVKNASKK
jgi:hypothetical protein